MNNFTDFGKGFIFGALCALTACGVIAGFVHIHNKKRTYGTKELINYAEKQIEIENLREDIINRSADEFLEIPDVRRAADGARGEFDRKRNEILERYRSQYVD
jgi:hypothetical protein